MTKRKHAFVAPTFRGCLHLVVALVLPTAAIILAQTARDPARLAVIAAVTEMQMLASANLHLRWTSMSPDSRDFAQRVDHLLVPICTAAIGWAFQAKMLWIVAAAMVNCWLKATGSAHFTRGNALGIVAEAAVVTVETMRGPTRFPTLFILVAANLAVAMAVFASRWPLRDHRVFGYHEIAHVLSVVATVISIWVATQ